MEKRIKKILAVILIISLTFLFLHFVRIFCGLIFISKIDYSVNAFEYVSLVLTSVLTILIAWRITKKLTEQRFEKEFLINDLKSIEEIVCSIENLFETSSSVNISYIASKITSIYVLKDRFCEAVAIINLHDVDIDLLDKRIEELYTSTTNFDFQNVPISNVDIPEIQQKCSNLIKETRHLIIKINNL